jgi:hypothetical protein
VGIRARQAFGRAGPGDSRCASYMWTCDPNGMSICANQLTPCDCRHSDMHCIVPCDTLRYEHRVLVSAWQCMIQKLDGTRVSWCFGRPLKQDDKNISNPDWSPPLMSSALIRQFLMFVRISRGSEIPGIPSAGVQLRTRGVARGLIVCHDCFAFSSKLRLPES